jgi:MauM/NapG family ferredoxin protein
MSSKLDQPHDRGSFFKSLGTLFAGLVAEKVESAFENIGPKLLRPPGALNELAFLTACTRCDKCIQACPQNSLTRAPATSGLAMGTPQIIPRAMPCFLCEALPCIAACPESALEWPKVKTEDDAIIEGPEAVRIGVAHVKKSRCLTFETIDRSAERCRACIDRCPYPGKAITLRIYGHSRIPHPEVIEEGCTGCGLCEFGCPEPQPGIIVRNRL